MNSLNGQFYKPPFSHIYIEKSVMKHPRVQKIQAHFPDAEVILIDHYKEVFNRSRQNYILQHRHQNLILAAHAGNLLYPGAPVCQNFGNAHFYYTSCVMNCIYDCEYCYLKGMYPSGNLVVFVNPEEIFKQIRQQLEQHSLYVCVSYDTDLLALEGILGYAGLWQEFVQRVNREVPHKLQIEIRTKSARQDYFEGIPVCPEVIYAFTLSPEPVIRAFEHGTPSLTARLQCIQKAAETGHSIRLCFDPMIYIPDWKRVYGELLEQTFAQIPCNIPRDVSVGSFRVSQDYLKKMRRQQKKSAVVQFPYENRGGVYQYPEELEQEMEQFLIKELQKWIAKDRIFCWK